MKRNTILGLIVVICTGCTTLDEGNTPTASAHSHGGKARTATWPDLRGGNNRSCVGELVQWIPASSGVPTTTLAREAPEPGCWVAKSSDLQDWCFVSSLPGISIYVTGETYGDTNEQKRQWGYGCRDQTLNQLQHHAVICTAGGETNQACIAAERNLKR